MNPKIEQLRQQSLDFHEKASALQATIDVEDRLATTDEQNLLNDYFAQMDNLHREIENHERLDKHAEALRESDGPRTEKQPIASAQNSYHVEGTDARHARMSINEKPGTFGFQTFGHQACAIRNASQRGGVIDPRLIANAPTTVSSEGVGADGGFAVAPAFSQEIVAKLQSEDSIFSRTDQMTTSSNSMTFPKDETTDWQTSGGIQVYWEGEYDQLAQSKLALIPHTERLNKITALVPVTEELLEDAPSVDSYLRRKVPDKIEFAVGEAIINGTGAGKPMGIMNSGSLISVAKSTSSPAQAADTVIYKNIVNMWARMYAPFRNNAVWLINQDVEPQLDMMSFDPTATAGTVPVYLPANGIADSPFGRLKGRPVIAHQSMKTVGDKGDILLADLSQYLTVTKTGGVRSDVSVHLWFDYDVSAFRFILRISGSSWLSSTISPLNGTNTLSAFVTLDERT